MLVHGGGFLAGSAENYRHDCQSFARQGFYAVAVEYPLGSYQSGFRALRRRIPRAAMVVGGSAGGAYALHLTTIGAVRCAVANAPAAPYVNRYLEWVMGSLSGRQVATPDVSAAAVARTSASSPLLVSHDARDPIIPIASSTLLERLPNVELRPVAALEPHAIPFSTYGPRAARFFDACRRAFSASPQP